MVRQLPINGGKMKNNETYDEVMTLDVSLSELEKLFDVLEFAYQTSKYLLAIEETKGSPGAIQKLTKHVIISKEMIDKLMLVVASVGRPSDEELN
jgi:hypothetical protein